MLHSDVTNDKRLHLTEAVLEAKINKGLTWDEIADGTGISTAFVTAALLGQHPLPEPAATKIIKQLDLGVSASRVLQTVPLRGSLAPTPPSDPTIYRFYEIVQIYGTTLKVLIHEQFGDGIMSAINFRMDIAKTQDPEGGERVVITLDGKFLPTRPF